MAVKSNIKTFLGEERLLISKGAGRWSKLQKTSRSEAEKTSHIAVESTGKRDNVNIGAGIYVVCGLRRK